MAKIPQSFIDDLLARINIVDLIQSRLELKRAGRNHQACCPFHQEKTPSFSVSEEKQFFHCFGCGAHGSALGFLMQYDNLSFIDAIESLAEQVGVAVPREHKAQANKLDQFGLDPYDLMQQCSSYFQASLKQSEVAKNYINSRELTEQVIADFKIGFAPEGWDNLGKYFKQNQQTQKLLAELDMLAKNQSGNYYDRFRHRITFPIIDRRARVIGFGARVLKSEDQPKYLNSSETPIFQKRKELYGLYQCLQKDRNPSELVVTEGYMDVVALHQAGYYKAVASMGTALTTEQATLLFRQCRIIVLAFDGDNAGQQASERALQTLLPHLKEEWQLKFLLMPAEEDPDTYVKKHGLATFKQTVKTSLGINQFIEHRLKQKGDINNPDEKPMLIKEAKVWLNLCADNAWKFTIQDNLAKILDIEKGALKVQTKEQPKTIVNRKNYGEVPPSVYHKFISLVLSYPNIIKQLTDQEVNLAYSLSPLVNQMIQVIFSSQQSLTTGILLEHWSQTKDYETIKKCSLWNNPLSEDSSLNELKKILNRMNNEQIKAEWQVIHNKISTYGMVSLHESEKARYLELLKKPSKK